MPKAVMQADSEMTLKREPEDEDADADVEDSTHGSKEVVSAKRLASEAGLVLESTVAKKAAKTALASRQILLLGTIKNIDENGIHVHWK